MGRRHPQTLRDARSVRAGYLHNASSRSETADSDSDIGVFSFGVNFGRTHQRSRRWLTTQWTQFPPLHGVHTGRGLPPAWIRDGILQLGIELVPSPTLEAQGRSCWSTPRGPCADDGGYQFGHGVWPNW